MLLQLFSVMEFGRAVSTPSQFSSVMVDLIFPAFRVYLLAPALLWMVFLVMGVKRPIDIDAVNKRKTLRVTGVVLQCKHLSFLFFYR